MNAVLVEQCPKGHTGRGILLDSEFDDAGHETRLKFKCEICGEVWWEDDEEAILSDDEDQSERDF